MPRACFWAGVFVLTFSTTVAAQQPAFSVPGAPPPAPTAPGPFLPPGVSTAPTVPIPPGLSSFAAPGVGVSPLSILNDDPPVRELPGFADLIPPPDPHHGGGHGAGHGGHGAGHGELPGSLRPFVPGHPGFYAGAEFLLMRPRSTDLDFVIPNSQNGLAITGPVEPIRYDLGTGVRAELGYRFKRGWETVFAYTYFTAGGDDRTLFAPPGQVLFPTLTRPGLTDRALTATAALDLDYQVFDAMIGRRFAVDDSVAVRVLGGLRTADVRQTLGAFYDGADARRAAVATRSRFQAVGPAIGLEGVMAGPHGFHLYTRASMALLTGRSVNTVIETNDNGATTYVNTRYEVRKAVPMGAVAIGGGWQYGSFSVRAGYEVAYWHGLFERPRFVDDVSPGKVVTRPANLSLEGLFIQVGFAY